MGRGRPGAVLCGVCGDDHLDQYRGNRLVCRTCGAHHLVETPTVLESMRPWSTILARVTGPDSIP